VVHYRKIEFLKLVCTMPMFNCNHEMVMEYFSDEKREIGTKISSELSLKEALPILEELLSVKDLYLFIGEALPDTSSDHSKMG